MPQRLRPIPPLALVALCAGSACTPAGIPGVTYTTQSAQATGAPMHIFDVRTTQPGLKVCVLPAGGNSDGAGGKWETTLATVKTVADREHLDLAVNGDFFMWEPPKGDAGSAEGLAALAGGSYRPGTPASVTGVAVTDGRQWSKAPWERPTLMVGRDGRVRIEDAKTGVPADVVQAVSGSAWLVRDGRAIENTGQNPGSVGRTARTAVGVSKDGTRLVIVVVDGLKDGKASGVSIAELAGEMARLGCDRALNLDGGGSSTAVMRGTDGRVHVLNHPTDGKARAVAQVLGVRVER